MLAIVRAGAPSRFLTIPFRSPPHHHYRQFLLIMHRESMVDFFGKKGTPLVFYYLLCKYSM